MQLDVSRQSLLLQQLLDGEEPPGHHNDVGDAGASGQGLGDLVCHQLGRDQVGGDEVCPHLVVN